MMMMMIEIIVSNNVTTALPEFNFKKLYYPETVMPNCNKKFHKQFRGLKGSNERSKECELEMFMR